ncbi:MAG: Gfo/Idh/MocA family oxidoreductase [Candidatus Hydrogenedentes bacterium]|nr:Gfo/Idh/MocA family oxidoreductase [Candidatus Hydrogenedentota bacterium]
MNVLLIGCGGMGRMHAEMISRSGLTLAVCADEARPAAVALAQKYGAKAVTDGLKAIENKNIDIVAIATPTPEHLPLIKAAARAGKHIFCEKPFCRTVKECEAALAAVDKAGVKLFVGHVVRYFHEFETLREQAKSGRIGEVGFVKLYRGGLLPNGPKSWFADYKKSGGVTMDCMIHDLDWLRYTFGEPKRIFCQALMKSKPVFMDYSQVTMRMKNGIIATVIGSWAHPAGFRVKAELCGSEGLIAYDSAEAPLTSMLRSESATGSMIVPSSPVSESPYLREWLDFVQWIDTGKCPRVSPADALKAVAMAEAALTSARTGQPVAF